MGSAYYNTNKEGIATLKRSNSKASSQQELIAKIFKNNVKLSASEVWKLYDAAGITPITSVRRAITNLCKEGRLFKTNETIMGVYGKKEHVYKYIS